MSRRSDQRAALERAPDGGSRQPGVTDYTGDVAATGRDGGRALRVLALVAAVTGLVILTAAACVLSYASVHALALAAGVSGSLARIYPLTFDAMLVVAGCSVLALRGAGVVSRIYGWLCLLALLAMLGAAGTVHAAGIRVPHRSAEIAAAVIPWALVLIAFGLLLALLRNAQRKRVAQRSATASPGTWPTDSEPVPGLAPGPMHGPIPGESPGPALRPAPGPMAGTRPAPAGPGKLADLLAGPAVSWPETTPATDASPQPAGILPPAEAPGPELAPEAGPGAVPVPGAAPEAVSSTMPASEPASEPEPVQRPASEPEPGAEITGSDDATATEPADGTGPGNATEPADAAYSAEPTEDPATESGPVPQAPAPDALAQQAPDTLAPPAPDAPAPQSPVSPLSVPPASPPVFDRPRSSPTPPRGARK
ncbi:MAG TPA: DUF2637 domain-containing protein [Streptosporangiaceae bacterium]|nr:DUF2637 domain-containing protein [Streptosporangiaceae bacterium]